MPFLPLFLKWRSLLIAAPVLALSLNCGGGSGHSDPPAPAPQNLAYPHTAIVAAVGEAIIPDTPTPPQGSGTFTVSPALPAGLALDSATGTFSGTPSAAAAQAAYAVSYSVSGAVKAVASIQITVLASGTPTHQVLASPLQIQEHSEWCWAATGSSVLSTLGVSQTQCAIVNYVRGISYACDTAPFDWTDTTANHAIECLYGATPGMADFMAHFGKPCTGRASSLSFSEIQSEIGAGRPFVINWAWSTSGGHILAGCGWDIRNGGQEVTIMDPWPGEGFKQVSYDFVKVGSDPKEGTATHTWKWSLTVDH